MTELDQEIVEGRHLLDEGVRLLLQDRPKLLDADKREARISELEKLQADIQELERQRGKISPFVNLRKLLGQPDEHESS